ncbi:hypothetical protein BDN67DRAFT_260771 [Paxillus ammoniavirescens]|nr:hypothetical protein BDN67DRAFT_260771 [Paxillus ammoniavirescens]
MPHRAGTCAPPAVIPPFMLPSRPIIPLVLPCSSSLVACPSKIQKCLSIPTRTTTPSSPPSPSYTRPHSTQLHRDITSHDHTKTPERVSPPSNIAILLTVPMSPPLLALSGLPLTRAQLEGGPAWAPSPLPLPSLRITPSSALSSTTWGER